MATLVATSILSSASDPSTEPRNLDDLDAPESIYARGTRLRALWTEWSVEVRVLSGALEKPRKRGFFMPSPNGRRRPAWWVCRHVGLEHPPAQDVPVASQPGVLMGDDQRGGQRVQVAPSRPPSLWGVASWLDGPTPRPAARASAAPPLAIAMIENDQSRTGPTGTRLWRCCFCSPKGSGHRGGNPRSCSRRRGRVPIRTPGWSRSLAASAARGSVRCR